MDNLVKQRVIGAVVLVALAVIFVPMLLEKPEDALGPVGSNLPAWPDQSVADRIEPLTLPEPPVEADPAQVVLDQPSADAAANGDAAMAEAVQQSNQNAAATAVTEPDAAATTTVTPAPSTDTPVAAPESAPAAEPAPAVAASPAPVAAVEAAPEAAESKVLSGWVVQLAALSKQDNALALRERLRTLGYTAFVEEIKTANGVQYRVRVGPELERANAENLRNRLEEQVKIKGLVMKYP